MKKLIITVLMALSTLSFAQDWYPSREKIKDLKPITLSKDTTWCSYFPDLTYYTTMAEERGTYFNANDFGLEYPINLHAVSMYLYDSLDVVDYSYRIYAKDGSTLLHEVNLNSSLEDYVDYFLDTPLVVNDDFWITMVPDEEGLPSLLFSEETTSDHSYRNDGSGWKPFLKEDERHEWVIYGQLSPFEGTDTYPPNIRTVTGTENFIYWDANLSVLINDQSTLTTVTGEYNLGEGWVTMDMTPVKGSYYYNCSVPGQGDGVEALVRFYAEDELGYSSNSEEYTLVWKKDIPLLSESFEGEQFPPEGWNTVTTEGTGWKRTSVMASGSGTAYNGSYVAAHFDENANCDNWIISPAMAIPNDGSCTLSFWEYTWYRQYITSGFNQVAISTDLEAWDVLYQDLPSADGVWENTKISLKDYAGQTVYLGFRYKANYEYRWFVDMISVFYDDQGPVITDIYGNEALMPVLGAYLNNPMNLYLQLDDASGVEAVSADFDIGGDSGNIIFTEDAENPGLWSGAISSQSAPSVGNVVFTLTDIGGLETVTESYEIQFVADSDESVIKYFSYGEPVLMGQDMPITLTFEDESQISSVVCYYSKDNWENETSYPMTQSKVHSYTYTCSISAEIDETFAHVRFEIQDVPGNMLSSDPYSVRWLDGELVISDNFDDVHDPSFWDFTTGSWTYHSDGIDAWTPTQLMLYDNYYSAETSLCDSPGKNYADKQVNSIMTTPMDFSSYWAATMYFWALVDIEAEWDFCYLEGTTSVEPIPHDSLWTELAAFDGDLMPWEYFAVNLGPFAQKSNVRLRFRLVTDTYENRDGIYIDDVEILGFNKDYASPLIVYSGPEQIEAGEYMIPREFTIPVGLGDYSFDVYLDDISDISEVKVVYTVDGGPEMESIPPVSSGTTGTYTLTIPAQSPGSKVYYRVVATDNSEYLNSGDSKTYMIRFGNYLYYQNGDDEVDYLDAIGPDEISQAVAKRITMGPMEEGKAHYKADLVGITIDNHINEDFPSDDMYVYVWEDAYGQPGKPIVGPIFAEQAATMQWSYEVTYVDLRPYADVLSGIEGDVYVGFMTAGEVTNILYEVTANHLSVPGYTAFERSWLGKGSADDLRWALDPASVYHISALTGSYELIDAPLPPRGFEGVVVNGSDIELTWLESNEDNLQLYNVYRGESENFAIGTPIATVIAGQPTTFTDNPPADGGDAQGYYYYKVTAVDTNDNESSTSKELKINPSGINNDHIPMVTELYQNYPNPFNPSTTIKFSIAKDSKVNLSVYNSSGQTVAELVNADLRSGFHTINFNGSKLTSGVYYTVLKANDKVMTSKMIMLK